MNQDDNNQAPLSTEESGPEIEKLIVPFEDKSKDFFTGIFETIKLVLFQPTEFFRNYKLDGPIGRPILFAVIIGWVTTIISIIWGRLISASMFNVIQRFLPDVEGADWDKLGAGSGSLDAILGVIFAPVGILIGLFIAAGIYHLFLLLFKGANKKFETTLNVVAYGMSAHVAEIIPLFGGTIAWIYGIVLAIIGLTEAHKTDSWRAVAAVFAPFVLCCLCCVFIVLVLGGTGFLAQFFDSLPMNSFN
ncbi:MAG: hypothetical protein GY950_30750 [bacterium]|nr:hypothetical protein [bacterium]